MLRLQQYQQHLFFFLFYLFYFKFCLCSLTVSVILFAPNQPLGFSCTRSGHTLFNSSYYSKIIEEVRRLLGTFSCLLSPLM